MKVAIQGELGSFSHQAARQLAPEASPVACTTAADVLRMLEDGGVEQAVIPVENSLAGSVVDFYDLFFDHALTVRRELQMRIRHNLLGRPGATVDGLRRVMSHPVALAQCREFFAAHPKLVAESFYDTAGAVQHIMQQKDPALGAIAARQAATQYGAEILQEGIEDRSQSFTRFWLIGRDTDGSALPPAKLSVMFSLENRPGALLHALSAFAARQLNLTKIESRPLIGHPWEYVFYADVAIRTTEEADMVVSDLRGLCSMVKELGRYPVIVSAS